MKEILLGTIGSGIIVKSILDNVLKIDGVKLVATYSRDIKKANDLKDKYNAELSYDNLDEFLKCDAINTVYIASPNSLHYLQAKKALQAKKNVILEKPFTPTLSEAKDLIKIAKENKVILVDATPTFSLPNLQILKEKISCVGNVKLILGNYSQYSSRYDALLSGQIPNVFNCEFAGGSLMDINYYNVYLTIYLFGKPMNSKYLANKHSNGIDTSGIIDMDYQTYKASLAGAKDTWGINYYEVEGDKGYIYIKDGPNGLVEIKVVTKEKEETFNKQSNPDRWYYSVKGITDLLLKEDNDLIEKNNNVMLDTIEIIEKMRKEANIIFKENK